MLKDIRMIFAGDPERANRFQDAVRESGWWIHISEGPEQAIAHCLQHEPDLVIIDDFPDSEQARSIFYKLREAGKGPFLVLNDSPGNLRFSRLGALSFIRMIKRDPEPADLRSAVLRLIESNRKFRIRRDDPSTLRVGVHRPAGHMANRSTFPNPEQPKSRVCPTGADIGN